MKRRCANCGEPIAPEAKACPKCGSGRRDTTFSIGASFKADDQAEAFEVSGRALYFIPLVSGKRIVLRNVIRKRANMWEPMLQVELNRPVPIIRCDRKDDIGLHLDMYSKKGKKVKSHLPMRSQTAEDAIVEVIDMLKEELKNLLSNLGFGREAGELPDTWKSDLENAKKVLLSNAKSISGQFRRTSVDRSRGDVRQDE